jgi:uncharacterized protein (TIGR00251 family)
MKYANLQIRDTAKGLEVPLHVLPRAKHCEISGVHGGALKVKVTAPPVDDAANRAIIKFLSSLLDISKSRLAILSGLKSREKILQIEGLSAGGFRELLNAKTNGPGFRNWVSRQR